MAEKNEKEKVAIIGAGITGLYLSWRLQEKGIQTTVFEKKATIGTKPCSALISARIKEFLPISKEDYLREVLSILTHFPNKSIRIKVKPEFLLFERAELDKLVYNLAKKSGAEVIFGQEAKLPLKGFSKTVVCDGALSETRKKLGLPEPGYRLGLQLFLDNKDRLEEIEVYPRTFKEKLYYGFFWKMPRMKKIEYGAIGPIKSIKPEFEKFLKQQGVFLGQEKWAARLVPQGIELPQEKDITLLGDAAGMTKPTTGGGVIWGIAAADILLKTFPDFLEYKKQTERFFKLKEHKGRAANRLGYFFGEKFPFFLPDSLTIDADLF